MNTLIKTETGWDIETECPNCGGSGYCSGSNPILEDCGCDGGKEIISKILNPNAIFSMWKLANEKKEAEEFVMNKYELTIRNSLQQYKQELFVFIRARYSHYSEEFCIGYGDFLGRYIKEFMSKPINTAIEINLFQVYKNSLLPDQMNCEGTLTEDGLTVTKILL